MVANLVDVAHVRLGGSLPIVRDRIDLSTICQQVIDEIQALHPQRKLILSMSGDVSTTGDASRIAELSSNLLQNAVQHGAQDSPITLSARDEEESIVLTVHNEGPPMPETVRARICEPLVRGAQDPPVQDVCKPWPRSLHRPGDCASTRRVDRG
jgi:signal transduction histidine kinase